MKVAPKLSPTRSRALNLAAGKRVEVRSREEILDTLDEHGRRLPVAEAVQLW